MLNQCQFIGHLGADPESRTFANGGKVVNLRLACSERWTDKASGEKRERTQWISVAIFNEGIARVAEQYLKKGSLIYISGQLETRKYQDQSGADRYSTEVVLRPYTGNLTMLGGKGDTGGQSQGGQSRDTGGSYQAPADDLDDSEIPF